MAHLRPQLIVAPLRIAVIGAGWAGCAAAVELVTSGHAVTLLEAARTLGGRARRVDLKGLSLDNGQHILLGAYQQTLEMLRKVGVDPAATLLRLPLQMRYPNATGMDFVAPKLPAPWHLLIALLRSTGLTQADKLALLRFSSLARWMGWHLDTDCSVAELLERFNQTERLTQLMWRPLCIAALNTPPQTASAQIFLNVLKDSLGARRASSDMLLPRCDLSALFPQHAAKKLQQYGSTVTTGCRVRALHRVQNQWRLDIASTNADTDFYASEQVSRSADGYSLFDQIVIATDAPMAATLLAPLTDVSELTALQYAPITTCYLQYAAECMLARPFHALIDDLRLNQPGQFVFDRGQLDARQAGLLAVVISASTDAIELTHAQLIDAVTAQLATALARPELAAPLWSKVITEKRATFSCTPGLLRPTNATAIPGIFLAGDYTAGRYPSTLESAVTSGITAAALVRRAP